MPISDSDIISNIHSRGLVGIQEMLLPSASMLIRRSQGLYPKRYIYLFFHYVIMEATAAFRRAVIVVVFAQCIYCKGGRNLCGLGRCALIEQIQSRIPTAPINSKEIFGTSPPTVFVGRQGYPKIAIGPLVPSVMMPNAQRLDNPEFWIGQRCTIDEIVSMRTSLYRSKTMFRVSDAREPAGVLAATQELAMSEKPVDTEVKLSRVPRITRFANLDFISSPMGPGVDVVKAKLTENPCVPRKVDAIVSDTDAKAVTGIQELYRAGIPYTHVQRLLSIGLLGRAKNRKLVPTRWAITATDDQTGKMIMENVRFLPELGEYQVYSGSFLGNYFDILLIPRRWAFEMLETWLQGAMWTLEPTTVNDWEPFEGRTTYADKVTGAYYAARLSVLEHLLKIGRQATAIVVREVTDEYWAPLGVWVIRETVKNAMASKPSSFSSLAQAAAHITAKVRVKAWERSSKLLHEIKTQRTLLDYL